MSNNLDITIYDFEKICRTCLGRVNLKPLYETCLAEMLMACTFVKFTENDGLPVKICTNCINEINQAFSFAKRCETTDTILRNCVKKIKTELSNNSSQSQNVEAEEEMQIEIKPEINLPNMHSTVEEIKPEEDAKIEFVEVKLEVDAKIDHEYNETYDDPADESKGFHPQDHREFHHIRVDEDRDETCSGSEKSDNPRRRSVGSQNLSKIEPKPSCYECKKCFEKFPDFNGLKKHREEIKHPPNTRSSCPVCNKIIDSSYKKHHMRTHTKEKPYSCNICGARFRQCSSVNRHRRAVHSDPNENQIVSRDFQCVECPRAFTKKIFLQQHSVIHGEKKFSCNVCGKGFVSKPYLDSHLKIHTGLRSYACHVCGKTYIHLQSLKNHKLIHTGKKSNVCVVCSKSFAERTTLKRHMRIHSGEKPYSCEICNKAFTQHTSLKRHMGIHCEKNPYCEVCDKIFTTYQSLTVHKKIHREQNLVE